MQLQSQVPFDTLDEFITSSLVATPFNASVAVNHSKSKTKLQVVAVLLYKHSNLRLVERRGCNEKMPQIF